MIRGLRLLRRDSGHGLLLASWHSPHSLTWSWILRAGWGRPEYASPIRIWSRAGEHRTYGFGVGSLLHAYAMRHNGGWQWGLIVLGAGLHWSRQQPMWFRDLYRRACDERDGMRKAA